MTIPKRALNQHIGVLGKTRSGKSSVIRSAFVEPLLEQGKPVCIIDPKGDWWGIKSSKSGKSAGYPVMIFGGRHADVPIDEHAGAVVAELVATGNRPALIDLGGWMIAERTRFFNAFASTLFRLTRGQRWLVIDECHNFAPQSGGIKNPDRNKMLHWANRLASEGLGRGITLIAASQRPQKVHKDFVTSMETLIAMRVIHPLDRNAIKDWMDGCGDPKLTAEIIATLASFKRGEAWVWSPEIGFGPKRMQFEMFKTYDSFKPQPLDMKELKGWASVDLEQVKGKLASVVEKAEANNPAKLRARIRELERTASAQPITAVDDTAIKRVDELERHILSLKAELDNRRDLIGKARSLLREAIDVDKFEEASDLLTMSNCTELEPMKPRATVYELNNPAAVEPIPGPASARNSMLTGPQQRILNALAWLEGVGVSAPDHILVALISGYAHHNSKGYTNPRGELRAAGLVEIEAGGKLKLVGAGREFAVWPARKPTAENMRTQILAKLDGPQRRVLENAIAHYPDALPNEELARLAGYAHKNSKGYTNPRGSLNKKGLMEKPQPNYVRAAAILFP